MTDAPTTPPPANDAGRPAPVFATTHWTRVLAARGESEEGRQALSDLCAAYYAPVVTFLQRSGRDEDAARDLAHEFFARVLARRSLSGADPERGRFRSYLLGALKHFAADVRDRDWAAKRGGGQPAVPLAGEHDTASGTQVADPASISPDKAFDRRWALTVLDRALGALEAEHVADGKGAQFTALKPWLTGDSTDLSQSDAAALLGVSDGAIRVAISRLRRRFRELVKAEIAQTVEAPAQVQAELRYLLEVLGS